MPKDHRRGSHPRRLSNQRHFGKGYRKSKIAHVTDFEVNLVAIQPVTEGVENTSEIQIANTETKQTSNSPSSHER